MSAHPEDPASPAGSPHGPVTSVRLVPDPPRAAAWAAAAVLLVTMAIWIIADTGGAVLAWIGLAVAIAVALYFAIPLVAPRATTVVLDPDRVHGRSYHATVDVPWDVVQVARVTRVAGESILELHVREPSTTGDPWRTRAVGILLPVGADTAALHDFLERRLGRRP